MICIILHSSGWSYSHLHLYTNAVQPQLSEPSIIQPQLSEPSIIQTPEPMELQGQNTKNKKTWSICTCAIYTTA